MGEPLIDALALRALPGLGNLTYRRLVDAFGSAGAALSAPKGALAALGEGADRVARLLEARPDRKAAETLLRRAGELGMAVLAYREPGYPALLETIYDPPAILYIRGRLEGDERARVAVVGSRRATTHALRAARRMGAELARENLAVVSGLAEGVDTEAHLGALDGGGRTLAVLGSGLDVIYPRGNLGLSERIVATGGAVLSEHPPGTEPDARHFPRRNRIISGLSQGVLVVEATRRSGSLITASLALEQGREVYASPGPAGAKASEGSNNLLRQGARMAENADDILPDLGLASLRQEAAPAKPSPEMADLGGDAGRLRGYLGSEPADIDALAARSGLTAARAGAALMELHLLGLAEEWPGKRYSAATL